MTRSTRLAGTERITIWLAIALVMAATVGCIAAPSTGSVPSQATPPAASSAPPPTISEPTPPGLDVVGVFTRPAMACAGPTDWIGVPNLVRRLADAWHERDAAARRGILDEVWGEDAVYHSSYGDRVIGRDAMSDVMGFGLGPGQYIELRGWDDADLHHDTVRLAWRACCPSGLPLVEGTDFVAIGPDGRIARVVSFWGRFVEERAEVACDAPGGNQSPVDPPAAAPADVCNGPDVDWSAWPETAQVYGKAWNERDAAARRGLLDEVWADDGTYADLYIQEPLVGREAFSEEIGEFLEAGFGAYFEPGPSVDGDFHHGFLRLPWTYCNAVGDVVWIGEDLVELDADGKMAAVLTFFVP